MAPIDLNNKPDIQGSPTDKKTTKNLWVASLWILLAGVTSLFVALSAAQKSRINDLKASIVDYKTTLQMKDSIIRAQTLEYNKKMDEWRQSLQDIEREANKKINN